MNSFVCVELFVAYNSADGTLADVLCLSHLHTCCLNSFFATFHRWKFYYLHLTNKETEVGDVRCSVQVQTASQSWTQNMVSGVFRPTASAFHHVLGALVEILGDSVPGGDAPTSPSTINHSTDNSQERLFLLS